MAAAAAQTELLARDPNAFERQAERRRRHWAPGARPERGCASGTAMALAKVHTLTLACGSPGCSALVNWRGAREASNKRGRVCLGDGCAGPRCAKRYRAAEFAARQCAMALQLLAGERRLCAWPMDVRSRDIFAYTDDSGEAVALAHAVLARFDTSMRGRRRRRVPARRSV